MVQFAEKFLVNFEEFQYLHSKNSTKLQYAWNNWKSADLDNSTKIRIEPSPILQPPSFSTPLGLGEHQMMMSSRFSIVHSYFVSNYETAVQLCQKFVNDFRFSCQNYCRPNGCRVLWKLNIWKTWRKRYVIDVIPLYWKCTRYVDTVEVLNEVCRYNNNTVCAPDEHSPILVDSYLPNIPIIPYSYAR